MIGCFHALLPLVAYGLLAVSAILAYTGSHPALFLVSAAVLMLPLAFTMPGTPATITFLFGDGNIECG